MNAAMLADRSWAPEQSQRPTGLLEFGTFRYEPRRRLIFDADRPCRIGSRALQLLDVLLESPGRLCSREELVSRVWPDTVVEETSLRVHMSALRRLLGDDPDQAKFIATVPGRGYAFVAPVREVHATHAETVVALAAVRPLAQVQGIPRRFTSLVGREATLSQLGTLLERERLVSVVGPSGVGKTSIALSAAAVRSAGHGDVVCMADLGSVSDPKLVAVELARACGVTVSAESYLATLEGALRHRRSLIVLDNCEHLIEPVATLVSQLMKCCPKLKFIVTSRDPLEIEGEWVFRVPPLDLPDAGCPADPVALLEHSAIQLFVERARAVCASFELTESNANAVRQLCSFLDGMPLAIELAAMQVHLCGVEFLAGRRDQLLELLTRGHRTAAARHRSLRASVSWSTDLLSEDERHVLQRLSTFAGEFELEQAVNLLASEGRPAQQAILDVINLCTKSMIVVESSTGAFHRYRLFHVVRAFIEKRGAAKTSSC